MNKIKLNGQTPPWAVTPRHKQPKHAPADDGFTYYISADLHRTFQPNIIIYVTKEDAAILEEKFKTLKKR
jgi:hypothetical protein